MSTNAHHTDSTSPLVLLGAGGHAKVVAQAILACGRVVVGLYDDDPEPSAVTLVPGAVHLGALAHAASEDRPMVLALGGLALRRQILERLPKAIWGQVLHPSAVIGREVEIGQGALLAPRVVVNPSSVIGAHAILNTGAIIEHDCAVGENAHIGPGAILCGGATIGANTLIGAGAVVLPGIRIGAGCMVGAGAVVTRHVVDGNRAIGVPAQSS